MSKVIVQPYLFNFNGRCEEALEFYRTAIGAEVLMLMRFKDCPEPYSGPPETANKVMHSSFRIGESTLMASDGRCDEAKKTFDGFSLHLGLATEAEVDRAFNALVDGGQVVMPLAKTFWSPRFGMLTDRFGLGWMISVEA
jgi:PhnB protein